MYYVGQATDIHKIRRCFKQKKLILGGYKLDSNYKIIAHSDGDLILHAIANAILGSIQKTDIGHYFSDKKIENKNLNSKVILDKSLELLNEKSKEIVNIDITVICNHIMLSDYNEKIINSLSALIGNKNINLKATRFENRNSTIQCQVVLLIKDIK